MSISRLASQNHTFPTEIFDYILEIICGSQLTTDPQQLQHKSPPPDLTSWALTCKLFASLCRPHIFRCICLGRRDQTSEDSPRPGVSEKRLFRLLKIFDEQPYLTDYVQQLTFITSDFAGTQLFPPTLMETQADRYYRTLSSFSNLVSLSILNDFYSSRDTMSGCERLADRLTVYYLQRGDLYFLKVKRRNNLPTHDIFSSRSIQFLELEHARDESLQRQNFMLPIPPTSKLISLKAHGSTLYPPFLLALPFLKVLHVYEFVNHPMGHAPDAGSTPSFRLKELFLSTVMPKSLDNFVNFYLEHAKRCSKYPFAWLETLHITVRLGGDVPAIKTLLDQPFQLKVFRLDTSICFPPYPSIELVTYLSGKLGRCTSLTLKLIAQRDIYESTIMAVLSLLRSLAYNNTVQHLTLEFKSSFSSIHDEPPETDPWTEIASILSETLSFPRLSKVVVAHKFQGLRSPESKEDERLNRSRLADRVHKAWTIMSERGGVNFSNKMYVI